MYNVGAEPDTYVLYTTGDGIVLSYSTVAGHTRVSIAIHRVCIVQGHGPCVVSVTSESTDMPVTLWHTSVRALPREGAVMGGVSCYVKAVRLSYGRPTMRPTRTPAGVYRRRQAMRRAALVCRAVVRELEGVALLF